MKLLSLIMPLSGSPTNAKTDPKAISRFKGRKNPPGCVKERRTEVALSEVQSLSVCGGYSRESYSLRVAACRLLLSSLQQLLQQSIMRNVKQVRRQWDAYSYGTHSGLQYPSLGLAAGHAAPARHAHAPAAQYSA